MKPIFLTLAVICGLVFHSCTESPEPPTPNPDPNPDLAFDCSENENLCELNTDNNSFGFKVFKQLHDQDPDLNIFMSPLSIATALSMTLNGAKGQTETSMRNTLEVADWTQEELNATYKNLLAIMPLLDDKVRLQIANSIWYREGYPVRPEFLEVNTDFFNSEVSELDFNDPMAKDIINGWVNDQTEGLIDKIVYDIPGNVIMYLINAIYFKGTWLRQFDPEKTFETAFHLEDNTQTLIDMMTHGETILPYFETEHFQAVDLAYGDSIFSMSLFLPKEDYPIDELVNDLESVSWNQWVGSFSDQELYFSMPKFEMEYEKKINRALIDLGMGIAFSDAADFSDINGFGGLRIDEVRHKAFVEVNEEGTEAAAVTSVVIVETSAPSIPTFYADKPFLFVIHERATNSVLFIGKMMDPNQ